MIDTVIFDVGKVLVDFKPNELMERMGLSPEIRETLREKMFGVPLWNELDRGVMTEEEVVEGFIKNAPDCGREIRAVFEGLYNAITMMPYAVEWVRSLKERGLKLYILSNYSEKLLERTKSRMGFLPYMDGAAFSYRYRLIKPDPAFYRALFEEFGIEPTHAVMLDDLVENIKTAQSLGAKGIVFQNYEQASTELEKILKG